MCKIILLEDCVTENNVGEKFWDNAAQTRAKIRNGLLCYELYQIVFVKIKFYRTWWHSVSLIILS